MTTSATQPPVPLRVLIVDDHVDSARALARLFRSEGHAVIAAHTVAGAVALVVGQMPLDVVVADVNLPDGDACVLLRRLRSFYGGRDLPAVALTGRGDQQWVEDCRRAGYGAFLTKPTTYEQVLDAVQRARASMTEAPVPATTTAAAATAAATS